ncbi:MAG: hypothetical protein ACTSPO_15765 [Candidatus Heimdallarchaeaceae archaeon]
MKEEKTDSAKMNRTDIEQFLLYLDSILQHNEIQVIPDTAKNIKGMFYKFFKLPTFKEAFTRAELEESRTDYTNLFTPIKKLINKFTGVRDRDRIEKGMQKETLEIMKPIEDDLVRAIENINSEIGKLQEDEQITIAEKSMFIAQESDKKAKRSNVIAIIALIVAVVSVIISLCIN